MVSKRSKAKKNVEGQTMFTEAGAIVEKPRVQSIFQEFMDDVSCPYCLYTGTIMRFATRTKKGISEAMFECPDCGNRMRRKTLTADWTPEQHAEWLYSMIVLYGEYGKIKWEKLKERLKQMGIANQFWTAWKKAKEEYKAGKPKSYSEHMNEEGELYARQQQEEQEEPAWKPKQREDELIDV